MDIMLDLETLGTRCGSVILSIGACTFDRATGAHDILGLDCTPNFHIFLKMKCQMAHGATIDPATVIWWLGQSEAARHAIIAGQDDAVNSYEALTAFDDWMNMVCPEVPARIIWANGADFDLALLAELYRKFNRQPPWPYNGARDMRTVFDLAETKPKALLDAPTGAHDALVDAQYQANVMALALHRLKLRRGH